MFRKTALIAAALALSAAVGTAGLARAEGDNTMSNIQETLRPAAQPGANSMQSSGLPRLEVIAGMERPVVVYDGRPTGQNFAAPGTLRVTPTDNGNFMTDHQQPAAPRR